MSVASVDRRSPWPPVVYVFTLPLWGLAICFAIAAFVLGVCGLFAYAGWCRGWQFAAWTFRLNEADRG